jgi:hypothetical protein
LIFIGDPIFFMTFRGGLAPPTAAASRGDISGKMLQSGYECRG